MAYCQVVNAPARDPERDYSAAKKAVGLNRHIARDTDGRLLMVNLTPAGISDSIRAQRPLDTIRIDIYEAMFHAALGCLLLRRFGH